MKAHHLKIRALLLSHPQRDTRATATEHKQQQQQQQQQEQEGHKH